MWIINFSQIKSLFVPYFLGPYATAAHAAHAREENRQALILFAIVVIFLICHTPRVFLGLHEVWNVKRIMLDLKNHCRGLTLAIGLTKQVSHLLLAINSSLNFFLYCAMSPSFRRELSACFTQFLNSFYQWCSEIYTKGML